jgi:hypothetical protein
MMTAIISSAFQPFARVFIEQSIATVMIAKWLWHGEGLRIVLKLRAIIFQCYASLRGLYGHSSPSDRRENVLVSKALLFTPATKQNVSDDKHNAANCDEADQLIPIPSS